MEKKKFQDTIPDEFWKIIQDAQQDPNRFRKMLKNMNRAKIIRFYWTYEELASYLRTEQFLPYVRPDLSEDSHAELANWIVAQGKEYYEKILENPELTPSKKNDVGFLSEIVEEYEQRFNADLPINTSIWDNEWKQKGKQSPWK